MARVRRAEIYMATTAIQPVQTAGEISAVLMKMGATSITQHYEGGRMTGVEFGMSLNGQPIRFRLPVRVEAVHKLMRERIGPRVDFAQAERTAWRQVFRWLQAQQALCETRQATPVETFIPYALDSTGSTTFGEHFLNGRMAAALPAGRGFGDGPPSR